ncbi:MAG: transposase [Candidatus Berkiellales bacterium]
MDTPEQSKPHGKSGKNGEITTMANWFKRINSLMSSSEETDPLFSNQFVQATKLFDNSRKDLTHTIATASQSKENKNKEDKNKEIKNKEVTNKEVTNKEVKSKEDKGIQTMTTHSPENDEELKALKRLRELPRGTQVESRIGAIQSLLGEDQVFKTLKMLRWPEGPICPRCHSNNVIRKGPPPHSADSRHYYFCLNCRDDGNPSDFDDFTGLPIGSIQALRQWILCWYLIGFCSIAQIAKVLGISIQEAIQMATLGSELTQLSAKAEEAKTGKELLQRQKKERARVAGVMVERQEEDAKSFSKSPTRPGPKTKL